MDFKEKITNRFNIIMTVVVLMISVLSIRLAIMTIAEGDHYREISDNKIVKDIYKPAIRGEIKDKNGKLLAGNKPSFTVQMLKDEMNKLSKEDKNKEFLDLIRLLEEDGASYVDDFPIELNKIKYANDEDYNIEFYNPLDKMIDIVFEKKLVREVLNLYYVNPEYDEHYSIVLFDRAINALKNKGIEAPIVSSIETGSLKIEFDEEKDVENFKKENGLLPADGALNSVLKLIASDKAAIVKIVDHSISRKLVYDMLRDKGLEENLVLEDYAISFEEDYIEQKRHLMKSFPKVTKDSSAEDDFLSMFFDTSIESFLEASFEKKSKTNKEDFIYPGKILLELIKKTDLDIPIKIIIDKENKVTYEYSGKNNKNTQVPLNFLVDNLKDTDLFKEFMNLDSIRPLAQKQLLKDEVNPKISVANGYEYVSVNELNKFYSSNKIDEKSNAKDAFQHLKEKYKIDENLSDYEARPIFVMYNQLAKQGYLAYQPVYIAYGIKEATVAKIEESVSNTNAINITIEPVRYYPEGNLAAHTLGYLGKISQPEEIKEYVEEKKYSPSSLIGKTGIEQSFEENLKGKGGVKKVEVDSAGNSTQTLEEEKSSPGDNIYLTLDIDLQRVAEESLEKTLKALQTGGTYESKWGNYKFGINKNKRRPYKHATSGAVVAIDIKTGKVLASASYPSYDPNLFSTGINSTDWRSLFPENTDDPLAPRPLYNIATQTATTPGSTIKMLTGLTALEKGLSPNKTIRDMGYINIGSGPPFRCLLWTTNKRTHGKENFYDALRDSCNYYFYTLAMGVNQKTGENIGVKIEIEDIVDMSKKFGLNDKTGIEINVPSEASGGVPSPERTVRNNKWLLKTLLNREIDKTFKNGYEYDDNDKEKVIEEITSWLDIKETLTYSEVLRRLRDLNINPEIKIANSRNIQEPIGDVIKFTSLDYGKWDIGATLNVTIGQGDTSYTPIQMANYVAIIANGGYKHKLTLIESIKSYNNMDSVYEYQENSERIELNDYEHLNDLRKGMLKVTKEGAYRSIFSSFPVDVAGKTGTAERSNINPSTKETYDDFSWFVAYAPYDDPQIAIATLLFQGGSGGYSAPMTRDIIAEYLDLNKEKKVETLPYENTLKR